MFIDGRTLQARLALSSQLTKDALLQWREQAYSPIDNATKMSDRDGTFEIDCTSGQQFNLEDGRPNRRVSSQRGRDRSVIVDPTGHGASESDRR